MVRGRHKICVGNRIDTEWMRGIGDVVVIGRLVGGARDACLS